MDNLNTQQLILLVLLVSFVTSIATGIITVSLLQKAPVEVTQTINRVVERTVETVVPDDTTTEERVVTVRETVVVSEEERVVDAVSQNKNIIGRVFDAQANSFLVLGVVSGSDGEFIAPAVSGYERTREYEARFVNGTVASLQYVSQDEKAGLITFRLSEGEYTQATLGSERPQLGQAVVSISGQERNIVNTGLVSDISEDGVVSTNLDEASMTVGSVLLSLSGDVIAIKTSNGSFVATTEIFATETSESRGERSQTASVGQAVSE